MAEPLPTVEIVADELFDQRSVGYGLAERLHKILVDLEDLEAEADENNLDAVKWKIMEARGPLTSAIGAGLQYADGTLTPKDEF
jgi:hypothetical protein